jgi:hypothetical protein
MFSPGQFAAGPGQMFDMDSAARALHAPWPVNQEHGNCPHRNKAPASRLQACVVNRRRLSAAPAPLPCGPRSRSQSPLRFGKFFPARPAIAESLERQHPSQYACQRYIHETDWLKQSRWIAQPVSTYPARGAKRACKSSPPNACRGEWCGVWGRIGSIKPVRFHPHILLKNPFLQTISENSETRRSGCLCNCTKGCASSNRSRQRMLIWPEKRFIIA